jgi:TPR repeat protein
LAGTACLASIILWQHQSKRPAATQIHGAKQPPSELERLQEQAAKGDSKAQVALGKRYLNGDGVATNWVAAVNWFRKAAEQGDPQGEVALGKRYYWGEGVATNWVEAAQWWERAAEKGDAEAIRVLSIAYYNGDGVTQDRDRSLKLLIKSAEQGNAEAQYLLAGTYDYNRGSPHLFYSLPIQLDKPQATNWYARALRSYTLQAEGGDAQAQLRVGQCCKNMAKLAVADLGFSAGASLGPDGNPIRVADILKENPEAARLLEQAFKWFKKAAEQGKPDAQLLLARAYKYGEGVQTNAPEAIRWYTKAAEQGDEEAPSELGRIYQDGEGVDKDAKKAAEWYIKAVERGDTLANMSLGFILQDQVTNDAQPLVLEWFLKSARKGRANAQSEVADYYMASPSDQVKVEAAKWYSKAAEQSDPHAQTQLGYMYKDGKGVEKDAKEAFRWFVSAHQILEHQSQTALEESLQTLGGTLNTNSVDTNRDALIADLKMSQSQLAFNMMGPLEFELAEAYQTGVGTLQNRDEAFNWYLKAANKGQKLAQAKIGTLYLQRGTNSADTRIEAHKWLSLAAAQGIEDAAKARDTLARKMTGRELAEASRRAKAFSSGEPSTSFLRVAKILGDKGKGLRGGESPSAGSLPTSVAGSSTDSASLGRRDLETLSLTTKVMEKNDIWWRWSYQLKVRNNTDQPVHEFRRLLFLDADGFIIGIGDNCEVKLSARETKTILGTTLMELPGAARVKTINVE